MIIKEIDSTIFEKFSKDHILNNHFQTKEYALLMKNFKYDIMYIGGYKDNTLVAASLILYKSIAPTIKYGYAPRGFLIDYFDEELLKQFTEEVKRFFKFKNFAFIKINPTVLYSKIDLLDKSKKVGIKNKSLISLLRNLGYEKLKNNIYFEAMLPKYNAIINLKKFSKESVNKKCYTKSHSIITSPLTLKKGNINSIDNIYEFIKDKSNKTIHYYRDLIKVFKMDNMIDLFIVELDYIKLLEVYRQKIERMEIENDQINQDFFKNPTDINIYNKKMDSDKKISELRQRNALINLKLNENMKKEIIGGAIIIKSNNKVDLLISGFDKDFTALSYKYFLYYKFIEYYKKLGYSYLDLNGITGDFSANNPYKELNDFKLSFNPDVYEYIGEFDLVINNTYYNILWNSGKLKREFIS